MVCQEALGLQLFYQFGDYASLRCTVLAGDDDVDVPTGGFTTTVWTAYLHQVQLGGFYNLEDHLSEVLDHSAYLLTRNSHIELLKVF